MFSESNILRIFFAQPTREFNVREVARMLEITPATVSKRLQELEKANILKYRKERLLDLYSADLDSVYYRDAKVYYTITKLRKSGLIDELNKFYGKPTIVLFGSCVQGLDTEKSDCDIVIVSEKTKDFPSIKAYEKKLHRNIQLFIVKNLKGLKNPHLITSVINGISIQGEISWT